MRTSVSSSFLISTRQERDYARKLVGVAREVKRIIGLYSSHSTLMSKLDEYANLLFPWARSVAMGMIEKVNNRNWLQWRRIGNAMGRELSSEVRTSAISGIFQQRIHENTELITSIPKKAKSSIEELLADSLANGSRVEDIEEKIVDLGNVTIRRARMIARTEISKTSTALTNARASYIGSPGYIWCTSEDQSVRESHRQMAGQVVLWSNPPVLDNMVGHAGEFPNCRCYTEVIIPEDWKDYEHLLYRGATIKK